MTEKQRQNKLVKLQGKLSDLESKLYEANLEEHARLNRMGWGHGMRCVKCSISTTKSDKIKERIKKCKSEIESLSHEEAD